MLSPALTLFLAGSAMAQAPEAAPPPEPKAIIVQGRRDRERQIRSFIRDLTPAKVHGQLGRFESSVCPAVVGLPSEQEAFIAGRIRRIAQAARMSVGKAGCHPNVILIVADDKAALVKRLQKERLDYFPAVRNQYDFDALEDPNTPVAAWRIEITRAADGRDLHQDMSGSDAGRTGLYVLKTTEASSRLKPATRRYFAASVVIIQADALGGLTTTQVADYAAMRAFVRNDPARLRDPAANTILNVIAAPMGTPVPLTMTQWDLSFLKSYYASSLNNYAANQRSEMRGMMMEELEEEDSRNGE